MMNNKSASFQALQFLLAVILIHACSASPYEDEILNLIDRSRLSQLRLETASLVEIEKCRAFEAKLREMLGAKSPPTSAELFSVAARALGSIKDKLYPNSEQPVLTILESCSRTYGGLSNAPTAAILEPINPYKQAISPITVDHSQSINTNNEALKIAGPDAMPYELSNNSNVGTNQMLGTQQKQEYGPNGAVLLDDYLTVNSSSDSDSSSGDDDESHNEHGKHGHSQTRGMEGPYGQGMKGSHGSEPHGLEHAQHGELAQAKREIQTLRRENGRLNYLLKLESRADPQFGKFLHDDKQIAKSLRKNINHKEDLMKRCLRYYMAFGLPLRPTEKTIKRIAKMPIDDRTMNEYFQHVRQNYYALMRGIANSLIDLQSHGAEIGREMLHCLDQGPGMPGGLHEVGESYNAPNPYSHSPSTGIQHFGMPPYLAAQPYIRNDYQQLPSQPSVNPAYSPSNSYPHRSYPQDLEDPYGPETPYGGPSGYHNYGAPYRPARYPVTQLSLSGSMPYYEKQKKNKYYGA